jgi:hypothetical protein
LFWQLGGLWCHTFSAKTQIRQFWPFLFRKNKSFEEKEAAKTFTGFGGRWWVELADISARTGGNVFSPSCFRRGLGGGRDGIARLNHPILSKKTYLREKEGSPTIHGFWR